MMIFHVHWSKGRGYPKPVVSISVKTIYAFIRHYLEEQSFWLFHLFRLKKYQKQIINSLNTSKSISKRKSKNRRLSKEYPIIRAKYQKHKQHLLKKLQNNSKIKFIPSPNLLIGIWLSNMFSVFGEN